MSINKVILIGNVGKDPEIKHLDGEKTVANFPLATTERAYKTKSGKEIQERTDWHNLVVWGGLAKVVEGYVKKGTQIYIEGKIRNESYDDKEGGKRYVTKIYVEILQLLGSRTQSSEQPQTVNDGSEPGDDLPF